jgi:hypothetical protein
MDIRLPLSLFTVITLFSFCPIVTVAQSGDFGKQVTIKSLPVPKEANQLFYLQRDPDANTVIYQLNIKNGRIDPKKPIHTYWKLYEEGGKRKNLNYIQRTLAYGVHLKESKNQDFQFELVAYKKVKLTLSYSAKHKKHVVTTEIKGKKAILDQVFVRIIGGTVYNPQIKYFLLKGRDYYTNEILEEELIPS